MEEPSRFVVGIDLGTTNSALAYLDTKANPRRVQDFQILQLIAPGETALRDTLPSFLYAPAPGELDDASRALPWAADERIVGEYAREHGATAPQRLVASTKSWLCHAGVDRTAPLLPLHAPADVERLSPIAASSLLLAHLKAAWNHRHPQHPLEGQAVVLTVPASFDETARELTVQAAQAAGLEHLTLLEEPQAAFYAWMDRQGGHGKNLLEAGQRILICDIGGGTSDFALLEARGEGDRGVTLHRIAVGNHVLLGGDNLDLALAHAVEAKLGESEPLAPSRWHAVVRLCRGAKEKLMGEDPPDRVTLSVPGGGARLVGGSRQVELTREEALTILVDGFMPRVGVDVRPVKGGSGFQEFGLPYAADPAMTRHLAAFVADQGAAVPDTVLLNGGLFESPGMRQRWLDVLQSWSAQPLRVLHHTRLDLAVARGAAAYGLVRRGEGTRIAGGLARAYYVGVEAAGPRVGERGLTAMCMAPSGMEEGSDLELEPVFDLRIRRPVEFPIYRSSTRTTDHPGARIPIDPGQLTALPPIRTVLKSGRKAQADTVRVRLRSRLTELGTLETWFREVDGTRSWRLQFDVRAVAGSEADLAPIGGGPFGVVEEEIVQGARQVLRDRLTAKEGKQPAPAGALYKALEQQIGESRADWSPALLRGLWDTLLECAASRPAGATQEARWLNLIGFVLRPGYGVPLDDWRVGEMWKLFPEQLHVPNNEMCRAEWWILWRRIAGGLNRGQQEAAAAPLIRAVKSTAARGGKGAGSLRGVFRGGSHETAEVWRLLGSLERLPLAVRMELGDLAIENIRRHGVAVWNRAGLWSLGRLGGRVPQYGPLQEVVPPEQAEAWLSPLLELEGEPREVGAALMWMARRTGDRYRDISGAMRAKVIDVLRGRNAAPHIIELVSRGGALDEEEKAFAFGETLPVGIRVRG
jgi:molecular chaperone DnaK (HSP70)